MEALIADRVIANRERLDAQVRAARPRTEWIDMLDADPPASLPSLLESWNDPHERKMRELYAEQERRQIARDEQRDAFPELTEREIDALESDPTPTPEEMLDQIAGLRAERLAVAAPYQKQIDELTEKMAEATRHIDAVEGEIETVLRATVLESGKTVKGHALQAVFARGRISWDDKFLSGYATAHPEILPARKQGSPTVSIREVK